MVKVNLANFVTIGAIAIAAILVAKLTAGMVPFAGYRDLIERV